MPFVADLHVHSRFSRATSRDLDLERLHRWAQLKGLTVVATGDFTHPGWFAELREKLVPAEPGLFALRQDLAQVVDGDVPAACRAPVRFVLAVEVSSIYKRDGKVRKVHNLIYAPDLESAARISARLARIGNVESDGRPILGLDSRDLLEIVLESSADAYLVPAHIWTPWFSALGAQSGFDSIEGCFGDLAPHLFAVETGLSSDPAMNWRLSALDRFTLISNSDAHSPEKLGREANLFDCPLSYFAMRDALRTKGNGFLGTIEFFPEEGKYHFDGHRKCGVVLAPEEVRDGGGNCPKCGHPLTAGVMRRVVELADRPGGYRPEGARPFRSLVPLLEVLGEVLEIGPASLRARRASERLLSEVGPEIKILSDASLEDLARIGPPLFGEAVGRIREGRVQLRPGHDGQYGTVRAFDDEERRRLLAQRSFAFGPDGETVRRNREPKAAAVPVALQQEEVPRQTADGLNLQQTRVVQHGPGPLLIVAGPGTGKTRTIVERIAYLVETRMAAPETVTAITFTRKAAAELKERLATRLSKAGVPVSAATFHAFGLELLRRFPSEAGLPEKFEVLDETARLRLIESLPSGAAQRRRSPSELGDRIGRAKAQLTRPLTADPEVAADYAAYQRALDTAGALDFDDLVFRAVQLLESCRAALDWARQRCQWLFVDEYQDVNAAQYQLVRLLAPGQANLCAVGDPDQAIYGFRGADPSYFIRFQQDYPDATEVALVQCYRCPPGVVAAAMAVIEGSPGRAARSIQAQVGQSLPVERLIAGSERDEAELIAGEIGRALGGTSMEAVSGERKGHASRPLALHEIAILVRTAAQMGPLAEALVRANIPFCRAGDDPLAVRPGVPALLARLRKLLVSKPSSTPDGQLVAEVGRMAVSDLIVRLGSADGRESPGRDSADLCAALSVPYGRDLEGFLDALAQLQETDIALEIQKVALLTLHAAKGLEFPLVFIAGCEDGLLPLRLPGRHCEIEEERRLLYVGMTRAQERLVLTSARARSLFGRQLENSPSPFLQNLPRELLGDRQIASRRKRSRQLPLW